MRNRTFARRYRPAWIAAALVLVFAVGFTLPPVRAAARDLLALFRVQKIQFVEVDPAKVPDEETFEAALTRLETVMEDQITIEGGGEPLELDLDAAREQAGFSLRLPAALDETPQISLEPYTYAEMQIDLPRVRALLNELGYDGQTLPDSLDGAQVSIGLGPLVMATYGSCRPPEPGSACTVLLQMPSPEVDAPPELDLNQLGQAYLQLLGMSPADAAEFSGRVDWTTTLVLPIPDASYLSYREVTVDGVTGTMLRPPRNNQYQDAYVLTWIRGGVVYGLSGQGSVESALAIADSLQ